jgi:hypothetical protein
MEDTTDGQSDMTVGDKLAFIMNVKRRNAFMSTNGLPSALLKKDSFSRYEYAAAMAGAYGMTDEQISYDLRKRLKNGEIVRQGWGQYREASEKQLYRYQ